MCSDISMVPLVIPRTTGSQKDVFKRLPVDLAPYQPKVLSGFRLSPEWWGKAVKLVTEPVFFHARAGWKPAPTVVV